jgi:imidazolonepropionase-like amidohydrolase
MASTAGMTAKDFQAIQTAIKDARDALGIGRSYGAFEPGSNADRIFAAMVRDIASVLAKQNPKFDRARFLNGCGVIGG